MEPANQMETNYNGLYPKPSEMLCHMLKNYLEAGKKLQLGEYQDLLTTKRKFPILIKKCIKRFIAKKCSGCPGSHQYIIAGGYAAYLADMTTQFTDIDIYIHCTRLLEQDTLNFTNYTMKTNNVVTNILYHNRPRVQMIQVNFDIGVSEELRQTETFRGMMAMYVLNRFDLPLCRVAAYVPLNWETNMTYFINATAFLIYKTPSSQARRIKYENRRNQSALIKVPRMEVAILFNLMDNLS